MAQQDEHKPTDIQGYRALNEDTVARINNIKEQENILGDLLNAMGMNPDEIDQRWLAISRTHFQEGFMALIRSIAKPTSRMNPPGRKEGQ